MPARDTPATRAARAAGISFSVHEYEHDERAASYGLEAVEKLGVDAARVFKTLVADVDGTLTVCVVPVERRLDLGALGKRARMAGERAAERATGYVLGGISPLVVFVLVDREGDPGGPGDADRGRVPRGHGRSQRPVVAASDACCAASAARVMRTTKSDLASV